MKANLDNFVLGLFFWTGSIMAIDGIIKYFGWGFSIQTILGIGFIIGSFTPKFFGGD